MGYKKTIISVLFLLFGFPMEGLGLPVQGNMDDIAKTVLTYFPKAIGRIISIGGNIVEIDLGREQGISEGVLLTVYREGELFSHPITGVPLGKLEEEVGTMEVIEVEQDYLKARLVKSNKKVEVDDSVRIPATRIPMAIAMVSPEGHHFLMNEFISALSDTGRFRIDLLPPHSTVEDALKRNSHYLMQFDSSRKEGKFFIDLQIQNTETGKLVSDMEVEINQSEESDLILEHLQYQLFEQREKQKEESKK